MKKTNVKGSILLIEDDDVVAESLQRLLEEQYSVERAETAEKGLRRAETTGFDAVVTDLQMPGLSGRDVITRLHSDKPQLPIILMTGHHTTDTAIDAIKLGAYDYVVKPINSDEFLKLIEEAVAIGAAKPKLMAATDTRTMEDSIVGRSQVMQNVYKEIGRLAAKPVTVLVRGETGTGKELVARALYRHSDRADRPFIVVNCVAIPETLLESELFGHEQGAFTGARAQRIGKFEQANQGTIFLDEIGDMSLGTQAKLLRVLQEKTIRRVGGKETITVDARVIAATHRDLDEAVAAKKFREDLYYRLNDAVIHLPPLRERREDIPDLVRYFLQRDGTDPASTRSPITAGALRVLQQYRSWPGNVRELRNVVQKAALLAHGCPIDAEHVRLAVEQTRLAGPERKPTLQAYVADLLEAADREEGTNVNAALTEWVERALYGQAIRMAEGDQTKVAKWLGVSRATVRERLLRYGFRPLSESQQSVSKDDDKSSGH